MKEVLLAIAEVAVALIGFSGLVAVFLGLSGQRWLPREITGLWVLISCGSVALVFSLLPFPLRVLGLSEVLTWSLLNAVLGLITAGFAVAAFSLPRRLRRRGNPVRFPRLTQLIFVATAVVSVFLLLASGNFLLPRGPGVYLIGLLLYVCVSLSYFAAILVAAVLKAEESER